MGKWPVRILSVALPLAVLAPASVSATTTVDTVVSGHALIGASPRFVKLSCALDRPLATSNAKTGYLKSATPGRGGKVVRMVPPQDALNAYGVVVGTPLAGLSTISLMADGRHGPSMPVVQYPTAGGAIMVGALSTTNSGIGWATFKGLGQPMNWIRYANGVAAAQGPATVAAIAAKFPATGTAVAGVLFGCDNADHDFELDNLIVGSAASARAYDFETAAVATRISLASPHKAHAKKKVVLKGSLAPAAAGIPIGVYRVEHGKRKLIRTVKTDADGRFSLRTSFSRAGKVTWSASVQPTQHWVTGSSGTRSLKVLPRPKPKPKPKPVHHTAAPTPTTPTPSQTPSTPPSGCTAVICSG